MAASIGGSDERSTIFSKGAGTARQKMGDTRIHLIRTIGALYAPLRRLARSLHRLN
jgi:hypothetical protein